MVRADTPGTPDETTRALEPDMEEEVPSKKPAILGSEGTTTRVALAVRPPKQPPPSTLKRKFRGEEITVKLEKIMW